MTKKQAFHELEHIKYGIPFNAIEFLYNHPKDKEIEDKVIFYLNNAYNNEIVYNPKTDWYSSAPMWYAIVAENYISESLIDSILNIYDKKNHDTWDFLNEQGQYLVGKSCALLGDIAIQRFMNVIEEDSMNNSDNKSLFLIDCLHFVDEEKYKDQILRILSRVNYDYIDMFVSELGIVNFKNFLPAIRLLYKRYKEFLDKKETTIFDTGAIEFKEAIKNLESTNIGKLDTCYYEKRGDWKAHYSSMRRIFEPEPKPEPKKVSIKKKIGRNDPCYCGSGKKYKKCCWPN
ncbi:MAG: SEC-C metal-binding domain-containing protein [Bacteroidota bacterium]